MTEYILYYNFIRFDVRILNIKSRVLLLDYIRGLAVCLMIVFHLSYDLWYFHLLKIDFYGVFWEWFRYLIVTLFFIVSGISSTLASLPNVRWLAFSKRVGQVAGSATLITVVTYFIYPDSWIYFGVLHFLALSMCLVLPFSKMPKVALALGISFFVLFNTTHWFNLEFLFNWLQPVLYLPSGTQDLTRFIPWFGMILIGSYLAHNAIPLFISISKHPYFTHGKSAKMMLFVGKHSLKIYLIHQPLLYGFVYSIYVLSR